MTTITCAQPAGAAGSGLARYRDALRTPGALAFAIPGVVGRMPNAMLSLALVMLLTAVTGSYAIAGAVSAAAALAYAAVTPRLARLADRYGQARVLRPQAAVFAAATAALAACAAGRAPVWALAITSGLSRAAMPSLGPMVRSRWSRLLASTALVDAAFSLEGIADELIFITGPVLAVALAVGLSPVAGVLVTAALSVTGVAGLGISATLATSYRIAGMAVPPGQRTEAMSWLTTAAATGTAPGRSPGRALDRLSRRARRIPVRLRRRPGRCGGRGPAPPPAHLPGNHGGGDWHRPAMPGGGASRRDPAAPVADRARGQHPAAAGPGAAPEPARAAP